MADEMLRGALDRAFDPGPDFPNALLLSRTMAMLDAETRAGSRSLDQRPRRSLAETTWPRAPLRLAAGVMAVVLALAAIALFLATRHLPGPTPVDNVPPLEPGSATVPIQTARFFDAQQGAVVTERGLLITRDGGQHWQLSLKLDWTSRHYPRFIDSTHINVLSWSKTGSGLLSSTADGGTSWQTNPIAPIIPPSAAYIPDLFFLNAREGWQEVSGDVYHTTDAGAHWSRLSSVGSSSLATGLFFTNSAHGYAGAFSADGVVRLYVTHDGGRSWKVAVLTAPPGGWGPGCCPKGLMSSPEVAMFGSRGFAVEGDLSRPAVYATSDGGQSWGDPHLLPAGAYAVRFLDPVDWWAIGNQTLYQTLDAGATWRQVPLQLPTGGHVSLDGLSTPDSQVLWGVLYSFDQGVPVSTCDQTGFTNCEFPIRSTDRGDHWTLVQLPPD